MGERVLSYKERKELILEAPYISQRAKQILELLDQMLAEDAHLFCTNYAELFEDRMNEEKK